MVAYSKLSDYAAQNIWCAPNMDSQSIIRPAKITGIGGVWNQVKAMWRTFDLPIAKTRFYVYQIGGIPPRLLGLLDNGEVWTTIADTMASNSLVVDLYSNKGYQLSRKYTWYMVTKEGALLLAVQSQSKVAINLDSEYLYVRFYTNRLNYPTSSVSTKIAVNGKLTTTTQDILDLQNEFAKYQAMPGGAYAFINGYYSSAINLIVASPGDLVEYVYDSSIYRVVDLPVKNLASFSSTKDSVNKFLLNYAGNSLEIDYHDDIDFWLVNSATKGVYYHRNNANAVRMVTHKDYSVPASYVQDYVNNDAVFSGDINNVTIRMQIRRSNNPRALVPENNRINEMYKLTSTQIAQALTGINATVDNWHAANLEASPYTTIMAQESGNIASTLAESALGYNAIAKVLFDTPSSTYLKSGQNVADVPYGLTERCTGYEYDSTGKILLTTQHLTGSIYNCGHAKAAKVEMLSGYPTTMIDDTYGQQTCAIDSTLDYRFYTCSLIDGIPDNKWVDVTNSSLYVINNGTCTWLTDSTKVYTLVRSNLNFLAYTLQLDSASSGILQFSLVQHAYRNDTFQDINMQVPMGELRIWMNDRELIEGIGYIVKFPKIVVFNKQYINNPGVLAQSIRIRFTGLADNMQRQSLGDVGYVQYGMLSRNELFNLRDDKVMHVNVDGLYYDHHDLSFSEDHPTMLPVNALNGAPYQVSELVTPLRGFASQDTYTMRKASQVIDAKVSAYLTSLTKDDTSSTPSTITNKHKLFSPFCNKIIYDLVKGTLWDTRLQQQYGDDLVRELCAPYLWLLDYDPTQDANVPDLDYCVIHPHFYSGVVSTNAYCYKFMQKVVALYCKNRVILSGYLSITL